MWTLVAWPGRCMLAARTAVLTRSISITSAQASQKTAKKDQIRWKDKNKLSFQSELHNPIALLEEERVTVENGHIYDKRPFKVAVKKYHVYQWCGCGLSAAQPFCDNTHANRHIKYIIKGGPVRYIASEDKDVWFCNCKQTKHRPFCDGTHRQDYIQDEPLDGKLDIWEPTMRDKN